MRPSRRGSRPRGEASGTFLRACYAWSTVSAEGAIDFKDTKFSLRRPLSSYAKVQHVVETIVRGRPLFLDRARIATRSYLDVGCGPNRHDAFIHFDYHWQPGIDICWDVTKGIPLRDHTIQGIFTEHCLEHIPFSATDAVLADFRRLLKPGGAVRIVVPDAEIYLTRYCDVLRGQSNQKLPYADNESYLGLYTAMMSVNRIFHDHQHQFIYDYAALRLLLEKNAFTDIRKESLGSGRDATLLIDTPYRAVESLYVEATSPS